MQLSMKFLILAIVAVGICSALPRSFHETPQEKEHRDQQQEYMLLSRYRRSPVPEDGKNHAKIGIYEDSRKGPVAKAEGSGTIWESRDKQIRAKAGVDYTQPLSHGRGEGSAFIKLEGTF